MRIRVLSLFDGISCARVALERLGYEVEYYASEVDKYAISVSQRNWPDAVQLGDVRGITADTFPDGSDLLIGGSPCQDLSIAKAGRRGLDGERSGLFWEYVRIWRELKPRYFVLENVNSMPKDAKRIISDTFGVEPIMINAALVSAQSRKRLFWTDICADVFGNQTMPLPEDRGILLRDILESGIASDNKSYPINATYARTGTSEAGQEYSERTHQRTLIADHPVRIGDIGSNAQAHRVYSEEGKSVTLSALGGGQGAKTGLYQIGENYTIRKLTPVECERLQSLPDGYTEGSSNTQRYKCLGNAFNVEVVRHILSFMEAE